MNIHPLAEAFPMMTDDELADLAVDIKENGQIHPIIVDADGTLVDGRNRLRACEIAGVEPLFAPLNGHDVAAFIVSANIARRNLSKGQQAMALALLYPEPERTAPGRKAAVTTLLKSQSVHASQLSNARTILRHSIELAHEVRDGRQYFDQALASVKSAEQVSKSRDAQLSELRAKAPDVAALVSDDRLTLEGGIAELRQRQQRVYQMIDAGKAAAARFVGVAAHLTVIETACALTDADLAMIEISRGDADPLGDINAKEISAVASRLQQMKREGGRG
jgi:ParB-like chromosome segregation protein Spo0J